MGEVKCISVLNFVSYLQLSLWRLVHLLWLREKEARFLDSRQRARFESMSALHADSPRDTFDVHMKDVHMNKVVLVCTRCHMQFPRMAHYKDYVYNTCLSSDVNMCSRLAKANDQQICSTQVDKQSLYSVSMESNSSDDELTSQGLHQETLTETAELGQARV